MPLWIIWLIAFVVLMLVAWFATKSHRPATGLISANWLAELGGMIFVPAIIGFLLGLTWAGTVVWYITLMFLLGNWALLLAAFPLISIVVWRKESLDGRLTWADGWMVFPSLLFGVALCNSTYGVELRKWVGDMHKEVQVARAKQEAEKKEIQEVVEKQNAIVRPQPVLSEEQKKAIRWNGGHDLQLPLATDGQWVVEGFFIENGVQPGRLSASNSEGVWKVELAKKPKTSPSIILKFSTGTQTVEYHPPPR